MADLARQRILDAFGVTEEDLALVEAETGWDAARDAAELDREQFVEEIRNRASVVSADLSAKFGQEVRWGDG